MGCGASSKFSEVFIDYPGSEVILPANKTTFVSIKIRPQDSDKLRAASAHARVTVDITVKVLLGSVTGVYMAVKPMNNSKDNNIVPVGVHYEEPNQMNQHNNNNNNHMHHNNNFTNPRPNTSGYGNRPGTAGSMNHNPNMMGPYNNNNNMNPNNPNSNLRYDDLGPGGCKLRLLPSHTNNFSPNEYYLSVMSGPSPGRIIVNAITNDRDVYGPHSSVYGYNSPDAIPTPLAVNPATANAWNQSGLHLSNNANYSTQFYRAKNQTDEEYIEELRWKITDLERELDDKAAEMERYADIRTMKKLEKQNGKLHNRIEELEREIYDGHNGHNGHNHTITQLEAQIDQYKTNAKKAKKIIEALNEKVEEKRRLLAIQTADLDEYKEKCHYMEKILRKHKIHVNTRDVREDAARTIQRRWRGFLARRKHRTVRAHLSRKRSEWRKTGHYPSIDIHTHSTKKYGTTHHHHTTTTHHTNSHKSSNKLLTEYEREKEREDYDYDKRRDNKDYYNREHKTSHKYDHNNRSRSPSPKRSYTTTSLSSSLKSKPHGSSSLKPIQRSNTTFTAKHRYSRREEDAAKVIQRNFRGFLRRRKAKTHKSHKPAHHTGHSHKSATHSGNTHKSSSHKEYEPDFETHHHTSHKSPTSHHGSTHKDKEKDKDDGSHHHTSHHGSTHKDKESSSSSTHHTSHHGSTHKDKDEGHHTSHHGSTHKDKDEGHHTSHHGSTHKDKDGEHHHSHKSSSSSHKDKDSDNHSHHTSHHGSTHKDKDSSSGSHHSHKSGSHKEKEHSTSHKSNGHTLKGIRE